MSDSYLIEVWGRHDQDHCSIDHSRKVYGPLSAWGIAFRRIRPEMEFLEASETDTFVKFRGEEDALRFLTPPNLWRDLVTNSQRPTEYEFEPQ